MTVTLEHFRKAVDAVDAIAQCDEAFPVDATSMALAVIAACGLQVEDAVLEAFYADPT